MKDVFKIVVIIILIGGGYLFYKNQKDKREWKEGIERSKWEVGIRQDSIGLKQYLEYMDQGTNGGQKDHK